ncbi:30S ribosomal protein S8 [Polystyrenella longa]|uniref:Small ribosomal subunit protein uS8 n=1 Tax=Polystyrenella longa TaxID=2528007 RepID=A0A518CR74_9PLAN|nr:30S ribosomal protein S8 [Polystyrenella longa]QDU81736.1 30S ribosomal protein S8 [Polystyrenella longa]
MMTDPIADMLTRIRNAIQIERPFVDVPYSNVKKGIAETLEREGYIWDFHVVEIEDAPQNILRVNLKYGPNGERVIQHIKRLSKPGGRVYCKIEDLVDVLDGLGINILSTSKGILSNREARKEHVGGELICEVW